MRPLILDNPAPLFLLVFAISLMLFSRWTRNAGSFYDRISLLLGSAALLVYAGVQGMNFLRGGLLWHDEANILSIASAYTRGQPMYHSRAAADFYSLFYGPLTYLMYAPFFSIFSRPIFGIRVALLLAGTVELILLYRISRVWLERAESIAFLSVAVAVLLAFPDPLLGFRGDVWLFLSVTAALLLAVHGWNRNLILRSIAAGLCVAMAIDLKVTAIPVACFVIEVLRKKSGAKAAAIAAVSCVIFCGSVFLLPHVSFANYTSWLLLSLHQRFLRSTCAANLLVAVLLLTPYFAAKAISPTLTKERRGDMVAKVLATIALLACVVTGSKNGAGPWHLWPVLPILLAGAAYELRNRREELSGTYISPDLRTPFLRKGSLISAALATAGLVTALWFAVLDVRILKPLVGPGWKEGESAASESLRRITESSGTKNISMGYGDNLNDFRSNLRYELPLLNQKYFFDGNEVVEGIKEGQPIPANVLARILGCQDDWLIPHGEAPFSVPKEDILPLNPSPYIFPDSLRLDFMQTHALTRKGEMYDVWSCKADTAKL